MRLSSPFVSVPASLWLSNVRGKLLCMSCYRCGFVRIYDADATLASHGDCHLPGLVVHVARSSGCERVYDLRNPCGMTYDIRAPRSDRMSPVIMKKEYKMGEAPNMRFEQVRNWHILFAECPCGRFTHLDVEAFCKANPAVTLGAYATRLRCKGCGRKGESKLLIGRTGR
ncbi:hypothetical protein [Ciceribacter sp. L1K22]|uniref:hypothetical protein n=1 Tax=Ciceribacter sp. L1K22 TaxID=2820275 RepID=UPI001ABE13F7|nr:hypothetical protein [Ciceribacter sp. L1K22]MBO3760356.1 hypothetical protein [Ciceribacter sp. L1K22]